MALISDRTGILRPQEATTFIDRFLQSIHARITAMEGEEALRLLHDIWRNLDAEESAVDRSVLEIEELLHRLASVSSSEELGVITARFHQLAAEQFRKRASVGTYHSHYSRFMELLISHATTSAADMLQKEGTEIRTNSWCVLVSGKLGRNEPSKMHLGRVILLADDSAEFSRELFNQLAYRTMAILELLLPPKEKKLGPGRHQLWAGTATNWRELVDTGLSGGKSSTANIVTPADADLFEETFRLVADLRPLCGSMPLAEAAIVSSRARVALELPGERFRQYVIKTTAMPVAIGIFGRFKTVKTGKHRGEFSLEELAIAPLVAATRVLAVSSGITGTSTVARIKGILAAGNLGVGHADRLLIAYHDFMKIFVELELAENRANDKVFFNPDSLDEPGRERFREGLEEITTLQRLVYQQLVEVA